MSHPAENDTVRQNSLVISPTISLGNHTNSIKHWYARDKNWSFDEIKKKYEPRILGEEQVPSFIVYQDNTLLGFIQYYLLANSLPDGIEDYNHPLFKQCQTNELVGIDLFIAPDTARGKGVGVLLINQFISKFLTQFKAVIVDPNVNNPPSYSLL